MTQMLTDFSSWLSERRSTWDIALHEQLQASTWVQAPESLQKATAYAALSPGKRVRPLLVELGYRAAMTLQGSSEFDFAKVKPAGAACEAIHAYSLIHDDLPCMDDDDLRRGQPTVHVAFGEALAVLAGDALQTLAFEFLSQQESALACEHMRLLAEASGPRGMVGGQVLDMQSSAQACTVESVQEIHASKTGALLQAALLMGVRAAQGNLEDWATYTQAIGLLYQATDDLLDTNATTDELGKTAGKDLAADKATLVAALGLQEASLKAEELTQSAVDAINLLFGDLASSEPALLLKDFPHFLLARTR